MFESARLKLTLWYLLIILVISSFFSFIIFAGIHRELDRFAVSQRQRFEREEELWVVAPGPRRRAIDPELLWETKRRLLMQLVTLNGLVLVFAGGAAYFLAGRTLRPIQEMVDQQARFVADASHELRTPLTALKTEIEVGLRDPKMSLLESKALLKSNLEEVERLQKLTTSLIEITRFSTETVSVMEKLNLAEVMSAAVSLVDPLVLEKGIKLENRVTSVFLAGERARLEELFVILLDNAIKYSPSGSLVRVTSAVKEGRLLVKVLDQGEGIAPEDLPHIFDRFFRADSSRSQVPGNGLGLSIAQEIVKRHHGKIRVKSAVGKGTTFLVSLPLLS